MTDDQSPVSPADGAARPPGVIFGAAVLLGIMGLGVALLSLPGLFDPEGTRCQLGRSWLAEAVSDNRDWNNIDIGAAEGTAPEELGRQARALPCAEAIRLAGQVQRREDSDDKLSVPSTSFIRIQSLLVVVIGIGSAYSAWELVRRLSRRARTMAIGFSAAAFILRVLGIVSLGVFVFIVYALVFSAVSRQIWPKEPRQPR